MCLYLYSENSELSVDFYLEEIFLKYFGSALIISDLCIRNISDKPVSDITFLCARSFGSNARLIDEEKLIYKIDYDDCFLDHKGFEETSEDRNIFYNSCGNSLKYDPAKREATISLYNSKKPDQNISFSGQVCSASMKRIEFENPFVPIVLNDLGFSLFTYHLLDGKVIDPGCSVLIRLIFKATEAYIQSENSKLNKLKRSILWTMFNSLKFNYSIIGPYDVKDKFESDLLFYKKFNPARETKDACDFLLQTYIKQYKTLLPRTRFSKIILHIAPRKLRLLHSFVIHGELSPLGRLPLYYKEDPIPSHWIARFMSITNNWRKRVYIWMADVSNNEKKKDEKVVNQMKMVDIDWEEKDAFEEKKFQIYFCAFNDNNWLNGLTFLTVIICLPIISYLYIYPSFVFIFSKLKIALLNFLTSPSMVILSGICLLITIGFAFHKKILEIFKIYFNKKD